MPRGGPRGRACPSRDPGASDTRSVNSRPSSEYRQVSSPCSASAVNPSYRKTWPRAGAAAISGLAHQKRARCRRGGGSSLGEFIACECPRSPAPPVAARRPWRSD